MYYCIITAAAAATTPAAVTTSTPPGPELTGPPCISIVAVTPLSLLLLLLPAFALAAWPNVYSGEHLGNLLGSPDNPEKTARSGVLVLYAPHCEYLIDVSDFDRNAHLMYFTHNYATVRAHTWYKWRAGDDLHKRYHGDAPDAPCFSAFYFKKGSSLLKPTETWNGKGSLRKWVWSLLKKKVLVINDSDRTVAVIQEPSRNAGPINEWETILKPNTKAYIETYVSYMLKIMDEENARATFYADVVNEDLNDPITVNTSAEYVDSREVWLRLEELNDYWEGWVWAHAHRVLKGLKQPLLVHNYTDTGYKKVKIPEALYREIKAFYDSTKKDRFLENMLVKTESLIVQEMVPLTAKWTTTTDHVALLQASQRRPTIVPLTTELNARIDEELTRVLQEWCRCTLKPTFIYGIREYYRGNVLHMHVDRVNTHVISSILQIDQDLGTGGEDWLLEVVDYNGDRQTVQLDAGEMLLYESAKLIHGRPRALRGNLFANAFVHFTPTSGWGWELDLDRQTFFNSADKTLEGVTDLFTPLTQRHNITAPQRKTHDEL